MLKVLAAGNWPPSHVRTSVVPSSRPFLPEVERLIDAVWDARANGRDVLLFDGPMARWESWDVTGEVLRLTISQTSYKPFLGTNLLHPELADRHGRAVLANPVGVSPALLTADGFLLLGRRNASVAYYPDRTHPFAGAMEPGDGADVFAALRRELNEELGLAPNDIADVRCTGIVEDPGLRQPEIIFAANVRLTLAKIESQVDRDEHYTSVALPATRDAVEAFIVDPLLTPVAVASLLLWGRLSFGVPWFDAIVRRLGIRN